MLGQRRGTIVGDQQLSDDENNEALLTTYDENAEDENIQTSLLAANIDGNDDDTIDTDEENEDVATISTRVIDDRGRGRVANICIRVAEWAMTIKSVVSPTTLLAYTPQSSFLRVFSSRLFQSIPLSPITAFAVWQKEKEQPKSTSQRVKGVTTAVIKDLVLSGVVRAAYSGGGLIMQYWLGQDKQYFSSDFDGNLSWIHNYEDSVSLQEDRFGWGYGGAVLFIVMLQMGFYLRDKYKAEESIDDLSPAYHVVKDNNLCSNILVSTMMLSAAVTVNFSAHYVSVKLGHERRPIDYRMDFNYDDQALALPWYQSALVFPYPVDNCASMEQALHNFFSGHLAFVGAVAGFSGAAAYSKGKMLAVTTVVAVGLVADGAVTVIYPTYRSGCHSLDAGWEGLSFGFVVGLGATYIIPNLNCTRKVANNLNNITNGLNDMLSTAADDVRNCRCCCPCSFWQISSSSNANRLDSSLMSSSQSDEVRDLRVNTEGSQHTDISSGDEYQQFGGDNDDEIPVNQQQIESDNDEEHANQAQLQYSLQ